MTLKKPHHSLPLKNVSSQQGQALIALLAFVAMAMTIITSSVAITIINIQTAALSVSGEEVWLGAESGAEESLLQLLRNPNYSGGTLSQTGSTVTMTVSGTSSKTILVESSSQQLQRQLQVLTTLSNNVLSVTNWQEIN